MVINKFDSEHYISIQNEIDTPVAFNDVGTVDTFNYLDNFDFTQIRIKLYICLFAFWTVSKPSTVSE